MDSPATHLKATLSPDSEERQRDQERRRQREFVKGPIPLWWLIGAGNLSGKALAVGVVLWFLFGVEKNSRVRLRAALLNRFGIDRHAGYRGLQKLESAGLVAVERHRGRCPIVTLQTDPTRLDAK